MHRTAPYARLRKIFVSSIRAVAHLVAAPWPLSVLSALCGKIVLYFLDVYCCLLIDNCSFSPIPDPRYLTLKCSQGEI